MSLSIASLAPVLASQDALSIMGRICQYVNQPYRIGSVDISVTRLIQGP